MTPKMTGFLAKSLPKLHKPPPIQYPLSTHLPLFFLPPFITIFCYISHTKQAIFKLNSSDDFFGQVSKS